MLIDEQTYPNWKERLAEYIIKYGESSTRTLRLCATTSVGYAKKIKVDKNLKAELNQLIKEPIKKDHIMDS